MFKDYYAILDIPFGCSKDEVKQAFKRQAKKWHPDKNPNTDTTQQMQDINEAYLILKDDDARERYNREYLRFKEFEQAKKQKEKKDFSDKENSRHYSDAEKEFVYDDEILKRWVSNARKQAIEYVKQMFKEVGELSVTATKAAGSRMFELLMIYLVFGFFFSILIRGCA